MILRAPWSVKASALVLLSLVLSAAFAPLLAPYDPNDNNLLGRLVAPFNRSPDGTVHVLGTDHLGRDQLSRVIYGARVSITFAVIGTLFGLVLGTFLGILAGYLGGRVDQAIMFMVDLQMSIPFIVICLVGIAMFGTGLWVLIPLVGLAGWDGYARYARAGALAARDSPYVLASKSIGAPPSYLMRKHVLPNAAAPIIVSATLNITGVILLESSLSFLGIGLQPPNPTWGSMISEGRQYVGTAWWMPVVPGVAIVLTTFSITLFGDWLRDALDPTNHER